MESFDLKKWITGFMDAHGYHTYNVDELASCPVRASVHGNKFIKAHEGLMMIKVEDVGGEGEGDHRHIVYAIVPEGQFFNFTQADGTGKIPGAVDYVMFTGFYESYNGTTWDDEFHSVSPEQQTIIVYR